jgi:hypothetical protein
MDKQGYAHAFVDIADARVIFGALARGEQGFVHKEYKGTPPQNGNGAVSRVLSIAVKAHCVNIEWDTPSLEFSVECEAKVEHHDTKTGRQNQ